MILLSCDAAQLCFDAFDDNAAGIILEMLILIYCFLALAIICDRYLVVSLETLCVRWNIREDVAGCTFMAFGSAAPEILINSIGTIRGGDNTDLGVGAIIGSGMIAFLVIPGFCGLVAKRTLQLERRPLLRDATVYLLALGLLCVFFADGVIRTWEAVCLVLLYIFYIVLIFLAPGVTTQYQAYTHRKKMWLTIRRAVAQGATAHQLVQLRESFLEGPQQPKNEEKHFVIEAAEEKERQRLQDEQATAPGGVSTTQIQVTPADSSRHDSALESDPSSSHGVTHGSGPSRYEAVESPDEPETGSLHHTLTVAPSSPSDLDVDSPNDDDTNQDRPAGANGASESSVSPPSNTRAIEAPPTRFGQAYSIITFPLNWAFDHTCKSCEYDSPQAKWYPLTFLVAFTWVSFFSFLLSIIVGRWVERSGVSQSFFGLVLVAIGAEIPDLIQSVTVASRGYGSMAVANSCGSQITNILIGLGLPWFLADCKVESGSGSYVEVADHVVMQVAAFFQFGNLTLFVVLLLLMAVLQNTRKAQLTRTKGVIFMAAYIVCLSGYAIYIFA